MWGWPLYPLPFPPPYLFRMRFWIRLPVELHPIVVALLQQSVRRELTDLRRMHMPGRHVLLLFYLLDLRVRLSPADET